MDSVQIEQKIFEMPPKEGISIAHFLTVTDIERSARYYEKVFGARILSLGDGNAPGYLLLANIWMILNVGGGPTPDKPTVTLSVPDPNHINSFMNFRVADIQACYQLWKSRGAEFITEPMDKYGWVGLDASGKVFARYGVNSRPTTVIVDGSGKVVAVTEIDSVNAADLRAVAERKDVKFKPAAEIVVSSGASTRVAATRPLFAVSVSKAAADATSSQVDHSPTGTDFLGVDADSLITDAFNAFGNRYVLKGQLPDGRYDLRTDFVDVPDAVSTAVVQQAVLSALHLQIQPKTVTKRAYVLRSTDASRKLLSPSASTHAVKRGYWHGMFILMNGTMDDLAYVLATGLENPVINETGIYGTFDARFKVAGGDVDSVNAVLKKTMGLELVPGGQEMSINVFEVSRRAEKPSSSAKTEEAGH